jgi:hypothetical protein
LFLENNAGPSYGMSAADFLSDEEEEEEEEKGLNFYRICIFIYIYIHIYFYPYHLNAADYLSDYPIHKIRDFQNRRLFKR